LNIFIYFLRKSLKCLKILQQIHYCMAVHVHLKFANNLIGLVLRVGSGSGTTTRRDFGNENRKCEERAQINFLSRCVPGAVIDRTINKKKLKC
jgi:hypothetical protein